MNVLSNVVSTLAAPVNATVGKAIGVNVLPDVKPEEALIYKECIGGSNISANNVALGIGEYDNAALEKLGLKDNIVGVRPGKNVQVTVFNPPTVPFVVGANIGEQCLPGIWQNQVKALKIERVSNTAESKPEGFGDGMLFTVLNILLVLLILFIVYRLVA